MSVQTREVIREVRVAAAPTDVFPYFTLKDVGAARGRIRSGRRHR